jgi:hypothetical protein
MFRAKAGSSRGLVVAEGLVVSRSRWAYSYECVIIGLEALVGWIARLE